MHCPNCRAALPVGSRFCNVCGASIGGAPQQPPAGQRTQMPGQAHPGQYAQPGQYAPQRTQMPYAQPAPPAYAQPAPPAYVPAAPPLERKKPIALLLGLLVLLLAGVVGACVMVAGGKKGSGLLAGKLPFMPTGSGVTQAANPAAPPSGPGVVISPNGAPPPSGHPVTSAPTAPDGMAPSVLMAPNAGAPHKGPSVMVAPNVAIPNAPSVVVAPNVQQPKGAPMTSAPNVQPRPGPPVVSAPRPPDPANDPAIERYLAWLHMVENEREKLHEAGVNESMAQMQQFFSVLLNPDDPNFDQKMAQYAQPQAQYVKALRAQMIFWSNFKRTKPPVPEACRYLDGYYENSGAAELQMSQGMLDAFNRRDYGRVQSLAKNGSRPISDNLKKADKELEKILDLCRKQRWYIDTGGGEGGLGGLGGMLGL